MADFSQTGQKMVFGSPERKVVCVCVPPPPPPVLTRACLCRSVDSPLALLPDAAAALEEELSDGQNWQDTVPPQLLATLSPGEVDRQAVIYGTSGERGRPAPRG